MRTIVCEEPGKMKLTEQLKPASLSENDVLIAIKRIGICGTDIHAFGGNQPFFEYPRVLGHELSGVVEQVGEHVQNVAVGDYVTVIPYMYCGKCGACECHKPNCCTNMKVIGVHIDGGMTEFLVLPENHVIQVNQLKLDEAAVVEPLSIGAHAVKRAAIKKGETVLIIGAGPIGLGVAKFVRLQGAKTIIMDVNEKRLAFCKQWADCDIALKPSENSVEELKSINAGRLPSVVLDATGNKYSMMKAFNYVSHGGKLVYVGLVKDTISFYDPDFHSKELTLIGSRNATVEDFEYVISCMNSGDVNASAYITHRIKFENVVDYFDSGEFNTNKALIKLGN